MKGPGLRWWLWYLFAFAVCDGLAGAVVRMAELRGLF
jgi:hypothetical protein